LSGYRVALMDRFIHKDVVGALIAAGKRAGHTAA
jgi:hypothetical protein